MKMYGANIKTYRKENNLKQDELAKKLGISSNMLGKIERGERKPNKNVQDKFFNLSGIKYEDELGKEIEYKLEKYFIAYISSSNISKKEILNLMLYLRGINTQDKVKEILCNIYKIPQPNKEDSTKYYLNNIFIILDNFYNENQKQCNLFYKNIEIFILDNIEFLMNLLSRVESSIFIHSQIPLYTSTIPLNTHLKTTEYLNNFQTENYRFAYIVQDNSMSPKYEKGNIVIIMEDKKYNNNDDVVVSINGSSPIIRKIKFKDKFIILQTYNDINKTDLYNKNEIKILGKIIEVRYINN